MYESSVSQVTASTIPRLPGDVDGCVFCEPEPTNGVFSMKVGRKGAVERKLGICFHAMRLVIVAGSRLYASNSNVCAVSLFVHI